MKFKPHAYQGLIIDHALDTPRNNTWAGMGMGKTVSMLTALSVTQMCETGPALVLAPKRVALHTWPAEQRKWDHLACLGDVVPILGTAGERKAALKRDASVFTINYDNLPWLAEQFAGKSPWPFSCVIADESTRLKSFRLRNGSRRAKAIAPFAHTQTRRWVNLTGTPAPNGLLDVWGQNWFVDGGSRLGRTFDAFKARWFTVVSENKALSGGGTFSVPVIKAAPWAQDDIGRALRDVTLTVDPKDYFDLREPIVREIEVELTPKARGLYRRMERDFFAEIDGHEVEAVHAASRSMKCLQIAGGAAYVDDEGTWSEIHDAKLEALESIVEEAAGMPVLVAYHWKPSLARILKAFKSARHLDDNPKTIDDWNAGKIPILAAHPMSAGHGLSLQDGGNIIVYFDPWWDLEGHDQILERIGPVRQLQSGYDRPVWVYYILAHGTLDREVRLRHQTKRSVMSILMEAQKRRGYA